MSSICKSSCDASNFALVCGLSIARDDGVGFVWIFIFCHFYDT